MGKTKKTLAIILSLLIAVQTPAMAGELMVDEEIAVNETQTVEETTAQEVISTEETSGDVVIEEEVPGEAIFEEEVPVDIAEEVVIPEETAEEVIPEEVTEEAIPEEITLDGELLEEEPVEDSLIPEDIFEEELVEEPVETITEELTAEQIDAVPSEKEEIIEENEPALVGEMSGQCGKNVYWTLSDDGVLTISGTGDMTDYRFNSHAPWHYRDIKSIIIESGVTSVGDWVFDGCYEIMEITIPEGVTSIGNGAFNNCNSLTSVTIPNSVTGIGYRAFEYCVSLTNVTIPDSVTNIGEYAFEGCVSLTNVTIPDSVMSIGDYAFDGCGSLTNVTIPDSVTSIGACTFEGCGSITDVTIPDSVTSIGDYAFLGCVSLTSVTIPGCVTSIGENPFSFCNSLTEVDVHINNSAYSSKNGVLFNKEQSMLISFPGGKAGDYVIPAGVTSIGVNAFAGCVSLTSVKIPESVMSIRVNAFVGCNSLNTITFEGDAPLTDSDEYYEPVFMGVTATAYYPAGNQTWTEEVMQDYGGKITWKPDGLLDGKVTANNFVKYASTTAQTFSIGATRLGTGKLSYSINSNYVTVDSKGNVTIPAYYIGKPTITITAAATDTYKEASKKILVTINRKAGKITANDFTKTSMTNIQTFSIGATRLGSGKLTYSSNSSKVTVDGSGKVTIPANYSGIVTITIKAAASGIYDEVTQKVKVTINPRQPSISSLSNSSAGKMTVQWKRVLGSTGYRIQFTTDKTFKTGIRSQMITPNNTLSRVISRLTKGKTYYVHMRTYRTIGGETLYSKWSPIKTLKITK